MDKLLEHITLFFKVLVVLLALRALIIFAGFNINIPVLDPIYIKVRNTLIVLVDGGSRLLFGGFGR